MNQNIYFITCYLAAERKPVKLMFSIQFMAIPTVDNYDMVVIQIFCMWIVQNESLVVLLSHYIRYCFMGSFLGLYR